MITLTQKDLDDIKKAVYEAEKTTSGEIVPVIAGQSDDYPSAVFRASLGFMIVATAIYYFLFIHSLDFTTLFTVQLGGLVLGFVATSLTFVKRLFVSKREMSIEVKQRAMQAFLENNLHSTRDRTGILIMVSLLEKRVEILADTGINEKLSQDVWDSILNNLLSKIKNKDITNGMVEAITECGALLTKHFPIKKDDANELGDGVVVYDS